MKESNSKTVKQFDKWSGKYDSDSSLWLRYFHRIYSESVKSALASSGGITDVLDIGCGTGGIFPYIKSAIKSCDYQGLDISPGMIQVARSKVLNAGAHFIVADISNFETEKRYDLILCLNSFHHYQGNQAEVIDKISKLLKRGGVFVLVDPVTDNALRRAWAFLLRRVLFNEPEVSYLTSSKILQLLNRSGLTVVEARYVLYFVKLTVAKKVG